MTRLQLSLRVLLCSAVTVLILSRPAHADHWTREEREAIAVVKQWMAAWNTKEAAKVGAYMSDDVIFRTAPERAPQCGRDVFVAEIATFMPAIGWMKAVRIYAIGGERDTIVLIKRDEKFAHYDPLVPAAAFFRVKDHKIVEWLDIPLVKELPPPPGGLPPPMSTDNSCSRKH
jgi:limonene-1,2-epoxide hydrolase